MITFRVDVDYAYASRLKSVCRMSLGFPKSQDYLENACVIAEKINVSSVDVKAYWFFTVHTLPNQRLLTLLDSGKHVVGLHVVNDADKEISILQKVVPWEIQYYSVHGTESVLGQVLWGRKLGKKQALIHKGFSLKSIHDYPTYPLDALCFSLDVDKASYQAVQYAKDCYLSIHPEWLFKSNGKNRGPFYNVLIDLLGVPVEDKIQHELACGLDYGYMEDEIHGC